jgi:hypothetical protein
MNNLREKMAHHGFESNDDYEYQIRCLLDGGTKQVRTLNIEGDSQRRKTAFANALAHALEYRNLFYHDFTERNPPQPEVILPPSQDEMGRLAPPIEPLDQVVSEACAVSEGGRTVLILDQLQAADFRDHLRINHLICDCKWSFRDARYYANPRHLLLFLISEEPLYHSLQKASFRVWVNRVSERRIDWEPADFGLGADAVPLFRALSGLFRELGAAPTRSEMEKILTDAQLRIRTAEHLRHSLFGRSEDMDRQRLLAPEIEPALLRVVDRIAAFLGTEVVELGGDPTA